MKIKKFFAAIAAGISALVLGVAASACGNADTIYVDTNAFFAPFEYYDGTDIVGVDVDIMNKVGEKLGKKVVFENTSFDVIIENVSSGKKYDCGAAGITITDARKEKVAFSNPYFTSVQYVICKDGELTVDGTTADGVQYVLWSQLAGKTIGVQTDTTGDIYVDDEISNSKNGVLYGTNAEKKQFESAQVAADGIGNKTDVVVVDKLPAQYIVSKNTDLKAYALYYDAENATEEQYAICVTKGNDELLNAINEVLAELGESGINALVAKHLGLNA